MCDVDTHLQLPVVVFVRSRNTRFQSLQFPPSLAAEASSVQHLQYAVSSLSKSEMLRPRGQIIRPQLRSHSFWPRLRSRPHGIWPRPHTLWPRPRKKFWASSSASLFLASVSASCPASLVKTSLLEIRNSCSFDFLTGTVKHIPVLFLRPASHLPSLSDCLHLRFSPTTDRVTGVHWLPIKHLVDFKIANTTFRTLYSSQPAYLRSSLHVCHSTRSLRLSNTNLLSAPFVRTSFGTR